MRKLGHRLRHLGPKASRHTYLRQRVIPLAKAGKCLREAIANSEIAWPLPGYRAKLPSNLAQRLSVSEV